MFFRPTSLGDFSLCGLAQVGFNAEFKDFDNEGDFTRLVSVTEKSNSIELNSALHSPESIINISSTSEMKDGGYNLTLTITPDKDLTNLIGGRLRLYLPGKYWRSGRAIINSETINFPLVKKSQDLLVGEEKVVSSFEVFSPDDSLPIRFILSGESNVGFYDLRKEQEEWGRMEVRVGQFTHSDWKKDDAKVWNIRVEFPGTTTNLELQNTFKTVLSFEQKTFLKENGYLRLPNMFSKKEVARTLRLINMGIREEGAITSRYVKAGKYYGQVASWSSKYTGDDAINELYHASNLTGVLADLLGLTKLPRLWGAQIALIFPDDIEQPIALDKLGYHIDGEPNLHHNITDWKKEAKLNDYNALVGVYLKDLAEENQGNFVVYPGSHYVHGNYMKEHGADSVVNEKGRLALPKVQLQPPVQVICNAGDVVIANYLTGHSIASHFGADVRYALYFRVTVVGHKETRDESLKNPWFDWPGLHSI